MSWELSLSMDIFKILCYISIITDAESFNRVFHVSRYLWVDDILQALNYTIASHMFLPLLPPSRFKKNFLLHLFFVYLYLYVIFSYLIKSSTCMLDSWFPLIPKWMVSIFYSSQA